jgi:DNA-binding MarR family transcriptional regulator
MEALDLFMAPPYSIRGLITYCQDPDMSTHDTPELLARGLGYALKRAQHALRTAMDEALRPLGLTTPQYSVLSALALDPGISNAALARAAFVTAQTMQGIVANLERAALLARSEDPEHGRILRGKLTRKGEKTLQDAHRHVADVLRVMLATIEPDEAQRLTSRLLEFAEAINAAREEPGVRVASSGAAGRARRKP